MPDPQHPHPDLLIELLRVQGAEIHDGIIGITGLLRQQLAAIHANTAAIERLIAAEPNYYLAESSITATLGEFQPPPDPNTPILERIEDLLKQLTLGRLT